MRYPSDYLFPQQRVRTPEETAAMERRVPTGDPSPMAKEQARIMARYLPMEITPTQVARIRTALSVILSPEATWEENTAAVRAVNRILKGIEGRITRE